MEFNQTFLKAQISILKSRWSILSTKHFKVKNGAKFKATDLYKIKLGYIENDLNEILKNLKGVI